MHKLIVPGCLLVGLLRAVAAPAPAEQDCVQGFAFTFENDYLGLDASNTDRWYTTGLHVAWSYRPACRGAVVEAMQEAGRTLRLPLQRPASSKDERPTIFFSAGHNWYTPANIDEPEAQLDDRPWADFVYGSVGSSSFAGSTHEAVELKLGLIGQGLAERVQTRWHKRFGDDAPAGWRHQLRRRLTTQLSYTFTQRWYGSGALDWAGLHWHGRVSVGRPRTLVATGITLIAGERGRIIGAADEGDNVGIDFTDRNNAFRSRWLRCLTFYAQGQVAAVAYNQFIEGTTHSEQPRIERRRHVRMGTLGGTIHFGRGWSLDIRNTWRSADFDSAGDAPRGGRTQNYGALRLLVDASL